MVREAGPYYLSIAICPFFAVLNGPFILAQAEAKRRPGLRVNIRLFPVLNGPFTLRRQTMERSFQDRSDRGVLSQTQASASLRPGLDERLFQSRKHEDILQSTVPYSAGVRNGSSSFLTPFGRSYPPDWPQGYCVTTVPSVWVSTFC